jgi:hypothetical protein
MMLVVATLLVVVNVASADIFAVDLGLGGNPLPSSFALGPWTASALPDDMQPTGYAPVMSAPGTPPLSGDVTFSQEVLHALVGPDWGSWAADRTPDVYYTNGATSLTLGMPAGAVAFALWVEPNPFDVFDITVTAMDPTGAPTSLTIPVDGLGGANGFGFYTTAGQTISSIDIGAEVDFAIGEFYGACVPEPATFSLLALGGLALLRRR